MDVVTLSWAELLQAAHVGVMRQVRGIYNGRREAYGQTTDGWGIAICGAIGELAVAKFLDLFWADSPDLDYDGDVGGYFVRSTARADGNLILHPDDPDERAFILVTGTAPSLQLRGWILGRDGKRPEHWQTFTGRPCYFVPQSKLQPMADLALGATL